MIFSLTLNGNTIMVDTFNLGGGASTAQAVVYTDPYGATLANPTNNGLGIGGAGGQETVFLSGLPTLAGLNTLVFTYTSLPGPTNAGFQGIGDEGWGIENVAVSSVPETSTWAMMFAGFAGIGFAAFARGRKNGFAVG